MREAAKIAAERRKHLAAVRFELEAKLRDLLRGTGRDELAIERAPDPVDNVILTVSREAAVTDALRRSKIAAEVRLALAKLDAGDYGTCEDCEELIAAKRLAAVPWARFCVACQLVHEAESLPGAGVTALHTR